MKRSIFLLTITLGLLQTFFANAAYILPAKDFAGGIASVAPNIYHVWVYGKSSCTLQIAGQELKIAEEQDSFAWRNAGKIKVEEKSNLKIDIQSETSDLPAGYIALAADEEWSPEGYTRYAKIFDDPTQHVHDKRTGIIRTTRDHYYHFPSFDSKREWLERKMELRDHIRTTMGVQPMPPRTPLHAKIFDRIEREGYSVEKVYFESYPGYYVTGNLYRPLGKEGPFPGILSPHGHWSGGRLADEERGSVPGRAINLARQGYVVFNYDMVGYVDSKQLTHDFGTEREWLWGIHLHGIQFWNSVRGVDFLQSLEDVDPDRIGCTGASGGGTQTYFLTAVDERVKVSAPVNMISAHFQGGCMCENAPNLRIHANNVEFSAMMAPRPLLMVSNTGDWTTETPWVEYPAIRSVYELFDAPTHVDMVQMEALHNYNKDSREAVYAWFGKWFLDRPNADEFKEQPFEVAPEENLRVFPNDLPEDAASEEELVRYLQRTSQELLQERYPNTQRGLQNLRYDYFPALQHTLGVELPDPDDLQVERLQQIQQDDYFVIKLVIGRKGAGDQIPGILLIPRTAYGELKGALLLHEEGKSGWFDSETGTPNTLVQSLLDDNTFIFMPDLFLTGEHHSAITETKRNKDTSHFYTYNQSDTALRVQDILTSLIFLQSHEVVNETAVIAEGDAGLWTVLAAPFAEEIDAVVVDAAQYPSGRDSGYMRKLYVPGLRRAGDFRSAQALIAPVPLYIHNTNGVFHTAWAKDAYRTLNAEERLTVGKEQAGYDEILQWLN